MPIRIAATFAAAVLLFAASASAQNYPTKVITIIVPFTAGGPTDTVARLIAQPMSKTLKQQVIVENVGGAGGTPTHESPCTPSGCHRDAGSGTGGPPLMAYR